MNRDSKRIATNHRPEIDKIKSHVRNAKGGFDGDGYPFEQAIRELKKEGFTIILNRETWMYEKKECYIEFLNSKKNFKKDKKYFNTYQEAVIWLKTLENWNLDMIKFS